MDCCSELLLLHEIVYVHVVTEIKDIHFDTQQLQGICSWELNPRPLDL